MEKSGIIHRVTLSSLELSDQLMPKDTLLVGSHPMRVICGVRTLRSGWTQILALLLTRFSALYIYFTLSVAWFFFCRIKAVKVLSHRIAVKPECKVLVLVPSVLLLNKVLAVIISIIPL